MLIIPYSSIVRLIPNELWGKLAPAGVAGYNFSISRAEVVGQLANGAIKVSFGEVRKGAPAGVFINSPAEDARLVDLPLDEVLAQLHPDAFARRPDQERVEVADDVPDVFGVNAPAGAPVRVMEKKEVSNTASFARQKTPEPPTAAPAPAHAPSNVAAFPVQAVPVSAPVPRPAPAAPAVPQVPGQSAIRMPAVNAPAAPVTPVPAPRPAVQTPPIPRPPAAPQGGARPLPKLSTRPVANVAPITGFVPAAPIIPLAGPLAQGSFMIGLDALAESWPDAVRKELAQLKIPDAKVALPPVDICEGLKRGRIQYPWRTLRSWIQPTPLYAAPSPNDNIVLELPLRTLTPTFLEFIRANPVNRQTAAADNITEFFRKAEQTSGTTPDVMQALLQTEPQPAVPVELDPAAEVAVSFQPQCPPVAAPQPIPAPAPAPIAPAQFPTPIASTEPTVENGRLCLPMGLLASAFPEAVQQDIAQFSLAGSRLDVPIEVLDAGIKLGKVEFAWVELAAWLNPPSKPAQVSINGDQRVALPLQVIGPIFLKLKPTGGARRKTAVMSDIPDLFNAAGVPQPPPRPAPEPTSVPVAPPSPVPVAVPAAPEAVRKPATNLSELFGEPSKKSWTPNDIVQRSTSLPGVAGALIALQDGLLVASSLPQGMKTEMIAAFVPQIFGRLNQYAKELELGDSAGISFMVEAGTFQIYNAGIIYFAAMSKKGETLPASDLQLIAAELSRHTK